MAKLDANEKAFLKHSCLRNAITMSCGKKTKGYVKLPDDRAEALLDFEGIVKNLPGQEKKLVNARDTILKACLLFSEFSGLESPSAIVDHMRKAMLTTEAMSQAISQLEKFHSWLVTVKGMSQSGATTLRGNFKSLLRYNSITITTDDRRQDQSTRDLEESQAGIDLDLKYEVLKKMFSIADFEMKAFIGFGMSTGWRRSDLVKVRLDTIVSWVEKVLAGERDYAVIRYTDEKEGASIACVIGRWLAGILNDYIATINDGRVFLFGDSRPAERLAERFENLLNECYVHAEGQASLITPHCFRKLFETEAENREISEQQYTAYTGHKIGGIKGAYRKITDKRMIEIYKQMLDFVSFGLNATVSQDSLSAQDVIGIYGEMMTDEGKVEHFAHMAHAFETDPEQAQDVDEKRKAQMAIAKAVFNYKAGIVKQVTEQVTENLTEKLRKAGINI